MYKQSLFSIKYNILQWEISSKSETEHWLTLNNLVFQTFLRSYRK